MNTTVNRPRDTLAYDVCKESTYSTLIYKLDSNTVDPRCYSYLLKKFSTYVCMYGHTYTKSMDQPGKVANAARGHLISVLCVFFPFILDIKFAWVYQPESHRRRSHKISHPPSFYDACLDFSQGGFSRSFPSSTVKSKLAYDLIVPHILGISDLFKSQLPGFNSRPNASDIGFALT